MAGVTLTFKGQTMLELSSAGTRTLKTGGTFCEAYIGVVFVGSCPKAVAPGSFEIENFFACCEPRGVANIEE